MELRSVNVQKIWNECVKCRIQDDISVDREKLEAHKDDISTMLKQIDTTNGMQVLNKCHIRKDGEQWTPLMQLIEMLILMGKVLGLVRIVGGGRLHKNAVVRI